MPRRLPPGHSESPIRARRIDAAQKARLEALALRLRHADPSEALVVCRRRNKVPRLPVLEREP